jgi:hypothetical protein
MEPTDPIPSLEDGMPRPREHRPLLRIGIAFLLAMPILAYSLIQKYPRMESFGPLDAFAWIICAVAVAWNSIEYVLGKAAYGQETPPWLRLVLAIPYFFVSWIGTGSISGMVASIAFMAGEIGPNRLP